jgi:sporulation protein YlmC with PRC-barrel domain
VSSEEIPLAKSELMGRSVFDWDGTYLGHVVAVGFRHGRLRRIGVEKEAGDQALRFFTADVVHSEDSGFVVHTLATWSEQ